MTDGADESGEKDQSSENGDSGDDESGENDEFSDDDRAAIRGQTRTVVAVALLFTLLGATLPRLASGDPLAAWQILLLTVLGLAAGVATLGGDSVRTAADVFRESGP